MTDYEIGYGKPPKAGRFRPGVSGNPKGRPKRRPAALAQLIKDTFNRPTEYEERGQSKVGTPNELIMTALVNRAVAGDGGAAELVVQTLMHAERHGDLGANAIEILNYLADPCDRIAGQKGHYPAQRSTVETQDARPLRHSAQRGAP